MLASNSSVTGCGWSKRTRALLTVGALLLIATMAWSATEYRGHFLILLAFHVSFWAMLLLALPKPRLDGYLFLAIFLFLGFWLKFVIHLAWHYDFIEPVGRFDGSAAVWDRALAAAAAGATGVALCRILHLVISRKKATRIKASLSFLPSWYPRYRIGVWVVCSVGGLLLYAANYRFAFFQTGVNMRLILPFKLSVLFAWASFCGIPLLFALLLDWELQAKPKHLLLMIVTIGVLSVAASVSILSRAITLFLVAAYVVAIVIHMPDLLQRLKSTFGWRLPLILGLALVFSLLIVSWARVILYVPTPPTLALESQPAVHQPQLNASQDAGGASPSAKSDVVMAGQPLMASATRPLTDSPARAMPPPWIPPSWIPIALVRRMAWPLATGEQVLLLSLDRWIGLEGVLSVASSPEQLGASLLKRGLKENAARGVDSIYQSLSNSYYAYDRNFTFLTLPGAIAVLFYSGSPIIVLAGMFLISGVLIGLELMVFRLCGSRFLATMLGIFMANSICQMDFPYLWLVFAGENLVAILVFYALRMPWQTRQAR